MTKNGSNPAGDLLPEPALSHYLALRRGYEAARQQLAGWEQALLTLQATIGAQLGLDPEDGIDERGIIRRADARRETLDASGQEIELASRVQRPASAP